MRAALPCWRRHDPNADVLYWNVWVQLLRDPCLPYYHRWMSPKTLPSYLFCVSDSDEAHMHGMVEVTLVRGSEETLEDPASNIVACRLINFTTTEFPIRQNACGYLLPSRWMYMLHEYGACSGTFCLPVAGCTTIVEAPIDWSTVEALPTPSERCEVSAVPPHERQVVRVIPQHLPPGPGRPLLGRGTLMLLNICFNRNQDHLELPSTSTYSSTSESDVDEWWDDDDDDAGKGGAAGGAVGGVSSDGGGGVYMEID